jgi:hypothetical protein
MSDLFGGFDSVPLALAAYNACDLEDRPQSCAWDEKRRLSER